ncbi:MAG: hypothetical protein WCP61_08670 [Chitinophagia bacterium]
MKKSVLKPQIPNCISLLMICMILSILTSCSVYETRIYSEPIDHLRPVNNNSERYRVNTGLKRFEEGEIPIEFIDSLDGTVISVQLKNEYRKGMIGPVLIPIIPHKYGYGYPQSKKIVEDEDATRITMELNIHSRSTDVVSFIPSQFTIVNTQKSVVSSLVSVLGISDITQAVQCSGNKTWKFVFMPGIRVEGLPKVNLRSLKINGQDFHPEGIQFKAGKKSFYSALVGTNG